MNTAITKNRTLAPLLAALGLYAVDPSWTEGLPPGARIAIAVVAVVATFVWRRVLDRNGDGVVSAEELARVTGFLDSLGATRIRGIRIVVGWVLTDELAGRIRDTIGRVLALPSEVVRDAAAQSYEHFLRLLDIRTDGTTRTRTPVLAMGVAVVVAVLVASCGTRPVVLEDPGLAGVVEGPGVRATFSCGDRYVPEGSGCQADIDGDVDLSVGGGVTVCFNLPLLPGPVCVPVDAMTTVGLSTETGAKAQLCLRSPYILGGAVCHAWGP